MKCQVMFFPLKHTPNEETRRGLQKLQDTIAYTHQCINTESKNKYESVVRKQSLYNRIRNKWYVIDGDLD